MACGPHTPSFLRIPSHSSFPFHLAHLPHHFLRLLFSSKFLSSNSQLLERRRDDQAAKERRPKKEELPIDDDEDTPTEDDKRKRPSGMAARNVAGVGGGGQTPPLSCQAEKCSADLSEGRKYYQRHKVCEHHAKAPVVLVAGLRQRFCQQCSRFHELSEFDDTKKSCRRRLAGHNERRRKSSSTETQAESSGSSRGVSSQLKENHCRQADQSGRVKTNLPTSANFKHFQIR